MHPGSIQNHEGTEPYGWENHQQWLHISACATAKLRPYTATKHAVTGLTKSTSLDGRKYDIACGQIDVGNAETERTAGNRTGNPQPNGEVVFEANMTAKDAGQAIVYMDQLPLTANVQFMTIMATKMPFIGRG